MPETVERKQGGATSPLSSRIYWRTRHVISGYSSFFAIAVVGDENRLLNIKADHAGDGMYLASIRWGEAMIAEHQAGDQGAAQAYCQGFIDALRFCEGAETEQQGGPS